MYHTRTHSEAAKTKDVSEIERDGERIYVRDLLTSIPLSSA